MTAPSFAAARAAFLSGLASPRDYLEGCLARIAAREPEVQAFASLDIDAARKSADASAARWRAGAPCSPIDGMPVALKDVIETADLPTGFGSPIFAGWRSGRDSAAAYALKAAGAIIIGKTVTTEFAAALAGPTRNPHDPARTPGGSSSGSAAAVAAGMTPVALGTQVGGSILRPASYCGVVGFKPTFGALNRGGGFDNFSQNCLGTLSADLLDGWAVCHEIAKRVGGDPGFPPFAGGPAPAPPRMPVRLAVLQTAGWNVAEEGAKAAFGDFLGRLSLAGVELIDRSSSRRVEDLEVAIAHAAQIGSGICDWEKLWPLAELEEREADRISPGLRAGIASGRATTIDAYRALLGRRDAMQIPLAALQGDVDACITLAATGAAPLGLVSTGSSAFNQAASALRCPALSLPLLTVGGLPLGVQLIGYPGRDIDLSAVAHFFERHPIS